VTRPSRDDTMLDLALTIAKRSTCARRRVGCVLTDEHGRVLALGHNGVAMGEIHCTVRPCDGAGLPSNHGLGSCLAAHAEANALMFCSDVMKIDAVYVTASPCTMCVRMLLNRSARRIVYVETYDEAVLERWRAAGRKADHLPRLLPTEKL